MIRKPRDRDHKISMALRRQRQLERKNSVGNFFVSGALCRKELASKGTYLPHQGKREKARRVAQVVK